MTLGDFTVKNAKLEREIYVTLCFHYDFGSFIPICCLYSHNSVNFGIGISSMRLNEGSIQISSQMRAKSY